MSALRGGALKGLGGGWQSKGWPGFHCWPGNAWGYWKSSAASMSLVEEKWLLALAACMHQIWGSVFL